MKNLGKDSGQVLLLAIFIVLLLVISIPGVVYLNQVSGYFGVQLSKRQKAQPVAEEGIAYAIHSLSVNQSTWTAALNGTFPPDFDGIQVSTGSKGGRFTIQCSTGGIGLAPYQVRVLVKVLEKDPRGQDTPIGALLAKVSQKTLGATLTTDLRASAAIELMQTPVIDLNATLDTHWGAVVSFGTSQWTLTGVMDQQKYPRKIAPGPITGASFTRAPDPNSPPTTDQKEYWAYASPGFPPVIATAYYLARSTAAIGIRPPVMASDGLTVIDGRPPGSGYFEVPSSDTATFTFDSGGLPYDVPSREAVIYVQGNAQFRGVAMNMNNGGAFIVTGNLVLDDNSGMTQTSFPLNYPVNLLLDYPYYHGDPGTSLPSDWPCRIQYEAIPPQPCTSYDALGYWGFTNVFHHRGFLYVMGDLIVNTDQNWAMVGALRVDGVLRILPPGAGTTSLTVFYDDVINHNISVDPVELHVDSLVQIAPT